MELKEIIAEIREGREVFRQIAPNASNRLFELLELLEEKAIQIQSGSKPEIAELTDRKKINVIVKAADKRLLPKQEPRIETGITQFGDDWQGLFIRGDNCLDILSDLKILIKNNNIDPLAGIRLQYFVELLEEVKE